MPSAINSNSGFQPQQSTIKLSGSSAISIQNLANFDALEIQGQVFLDGSSSDYRASVKVSVIKNGAGAYEVVATDIAGDDYLGSPICSFSVADSYLQITLDASLVAAQSPALDTSYIKFNIDTPSPALVGSSSLSIEASNIVSGTINSDRLPSATLTTPGISLGQSPNIIDFTPYLSSTGSFGSAITRLSGISFKKDDGNFVAICQIVWPHSSAYTTQKRTVSGITLISAYGAISSASGKTAYVNLQASAFYLESTAVGDATDKIGTVIFEYSVP